MTKFTKGTSVQLGAGLMVGKIKTPPSSNNQDTAVVTLSTGEDIFAHETALEIATD